MCEYGFYQVPRPEEITRSRKVVVPDDSGDLKVRLDILSPSKSTGVRQYLGTKVYVKNVMYKRSGSGFVFLFSRLKSTQAQRKDF